MPSSLSSLPEAPIAERLCDLSPEERRVFVSNIPDDELLDAFFDWEGMWARPDQREPPGDWMYWLMRSGRGAGKTRTGAEWIRSKVEKGIYGQLALVAPTAADVRDVVVEGESGILATAHPDCRPVYKPSKLRLEWPNGAYAHLYSAEEPDRLRGPQHDAAWCDELAAWRHPETWDMLLLGLRLGQQPRVIISTTPRPTPLVKRIAANPATVQTVAATYANVAYLAPQFMKVIVDAYKDTHLGRQEIYGEIIEDMLGALWTRAMLDSTRLDQKATAKLKEQLTRIVVAVDPAGSTEEGSDETGIVVVGIDGQDPPHGYVLEDVSGRYTPLQWAERAVNAYHRWGADRVVAEVNFGGDLVAANIRNVEPNISYRKVSASRGKYVRAEPVGALYEQGRVHHAGLFGPLEDQMCMMTPDLDRRAFGSPDRADAMVWGFSYLMVGKHVPRVARSRSG